MTIATGQQILAADVALGANMPSGAIIIWAGTIASIPSGWIICDGNNGTPNLLAKFVEGVATAATNPGTTGGATSHIHSGPSHTHERGVGDYSATASGAAGMGLALSGTVLQIPSPAVAAGGTANTGSSDGRPLFYDVAFLRKS